MCTLTILKNWWILKDLWINFLRVSYPEYILHIFRILFSIWYSIITSLINSANTIKHLLCIRVCPQGTEYAGVNERDMGGWPRGRVVKFACSTSVAQFRSWVRTWHHSSGHAEVVFHMPQLEGPITENTQLCTGGLWGEKGKIKSLK